MITGITIAVIVIVATIVIAVFFYMKRDSISRDYSTSVVSFSEDAPNEVIIDTTDQIATVDNPLVMMSMINSLELDSNDSANQYAYESESEYVFEEFLDFLPM